MDRQQLQQQGWSAGSYTVTVKDDNNCQTTAGPVTITEPTAVSASMGAPTMIILMVTIMEVSQ